MKAGHNQACYYCGRQMSRKEKYRNKENYATKDHIVPRANNGHAIVRCCLACNHAKGCLSVNEFRAVLMLRKRRPVVFHFEWCLLRILSRSIVWECSKWAVSL